MFHRIHRRDAEATPGAAPLTSPGEPTEQPRRKRTAPRLEGLTPAAHACGHAREAQPPASSKARQAQTCKPEPTHEQRHEESSHEISPALQALLDRHVPGWTLGKALIVLAHPDDETMMVKLIWILLTLGVEVNLVYVTQSNGGTAYVNETGIQRPSYAASGKEALFSQIYGEKRVEQSLGLLGDLTPDPDLLRVHVLSYPDRSPYNAPAERSIRYSQVADWNDEHIVEFLARLIRTIGPDIAVSLRAEPVVHPAHSEDALLLDAALERVAHDDGAKTPVRLSAAEAGWYEKRHRRPVPLHRAIEGRYSDSEFATIRAILAKWFGAMPGCAVPNDIQQPPGNKRQWDAELQYELLEAAPGTDPRIVDFFNALLNTSSLPVDMTQALADKLTDTERAPAAAQVFIHEPQIPADASSNGARAQGVELVPAATFTTHVGPQTDSWLASLPERVRRARLGNGPQPHEMTEHEREGLAAFKAPPRHVSDHVSLGARLRALRPSVRAQGDRVTAGPRRDSVLWVLSSKRMPHEVIGERQLGLELDSHTRPFASPESAKERAIRILGSTPDADVAVYRLDAPAAELLEALRCKRIDSSLVSRAAMVLDDKGTFYQTSIANPQARYRPEPGAPYGPPPVTGMPRTRMRLATAAALGKVGATASAAYLGMRYGMHLPNDMTMEIMLEAGRAMFAARAGINAAKTATSVRILQLADALGAEREQHLSARAAPASATDERLALLPALDTLERRTTGVRGILRGYRKHDRAELAMLAETMRLTPEDVDALRRLDSLSQDGLFASESPIERARRTFWGLSYAPSDIAAAGIWAAPEIMMTGLDSVEGMAHWFVNFATLLFVPVHLSGNGGQRLARSLDVIANKHDLDPTIPAAGDKLRDFLPGTEHLSRWRQALLGDLLKYARIRPDGGRMYEPPMFMRLPAFQMLGATLASVPFGVANALGGVDSMISGNLTATALQSAMVAADAMFLRGFWHAYENVGGANRGRGPIVRRGPLPALRPPLRGAEHVPADITQPHLVDRGVLRRFDPDLVIAAGMGTQVALGFMLSAMS